MRIYAVERDPKHLLLVDDSGYVVNGAYNIKMGQLGITKTILKLML